VPKPSALKVATLRAAHRLLDTPIVFEDPLALKILGAAEEGSLRGPLRDNAPRLRGPRTSLVVRSRLAEDEWVYSKHRGIRRVCFRSDGGLVQKIFTSSPSPNRAFSSATEV
jgi:hypothetical protein